MLSQFKKFMSQGKFSSLFKKLNSSAECRRSQSEWIAYLQYRKTSNISRTLLGYKIVD